METGRCALLSFVLAIVSSPFFLLEWEARWQNPVLRPSHGIGDGDMAMRLKLRRNMIFCFISTPQCALFTRTAGDFESPSPAQLRSRPNELF